MELVRIPSQELENIWGLIEKDVKQSLLYSGQLATPEFVFETAKKGKFQVWILWDKQQKTSVEKYFGLVITEIRSQPLGNVCHIYMMTGRQRHKWQFLIYRTQVGRYKHFPTIHYSKDQTPSEWETPKLSGKSLF